MQNSLDMRVNQRTVELDGKVYKMDFDMMALSIAENVYKTQFERNLNVSEIIVELFEMKMCAVMAFTYGAIRSAGQVMTWGEFSKSIFSYGNFDDVFDVVSDAISELFSVNGDEKDESADAEQDKEKN